MSGGQGGGGFGGGAFGGSDSGFRLLINDTQTINSLSPDIFTSIAVIQRSGYINSTEHERVTTIVGVNFTEYKNTYSTTFVPGSGEIPDKPANNTVVIGKRVNERQNGTVLFTAGEDVQILWTNATARPPQNESYTK